MRGFVVVISDVFDFFLGHEGITTFHLAHCPFHGGESLVGLSDNRSQKMRDAIVLGHLDLLRIHDDELHLGGGVAIEKRGDQRVGHD